MKAKPIRTLLLACFIFGGDAFVSCLSLSAQPEAFPVTITLPKPAFDFSDLDARDEFNRPIKTAFAQRTLELLFVSGLNDLLLRNLTPMRRHIELVLSQSWNLASGLLRAATHFVRWVAQGWLSSKKLRAPLRSLLSFSWPVSAASHPIYSPHNSFLFLISDVLASTRLLR